MRVAVLTISDAGARGQRADTSGDAIVAWASARGHPVSARALVADEATDITRQLVRWADEDAADLVITTGGTGLTPRDVTPEATRAAIQKDASGIAEAIRFAAFQHFPRAALARGVAGVRSRTLIVNLPGSTGGVKDGLAVLDGIVEHAVALVRGGQSDHG